MATIRRIVCLANSRKTSGRCIAGKLVDETGAFGKWIRPVSERATQEVSEEERWYENGRDPQLLDIIDIPVLEPRPHLHQVENELIDATLYWTKRGQVGWDEIQNAIDDDENSLWMNGASSYYGRNDRVHIGAAGKIKSSLMLIEPQDLKITVATEGAEFNNPRRKVRARFDWKDDSYILPVTDPLIERKYRALENGEYAMKSTLMCVSLGEEHDGYYYKFAAGLLTPDRADK